MVGGETGAGRLQSIRACRAFENPRAFVGREAHLAFAQEENAAATRAVGGVGSRRELADPAKLRAVVDAAGGRGKQDEQRWASASHDNGSS